MCILYTNGGGGGGGSSCCGDGGVVITTTCATFDIVKIKYDAVLMKPDKRYCSIQRLRYLLCSPGFQ
jgi:hypothetical protein